MALLDPNRLGLLPRRLLPCPLLAALCLLAAPVVHADDDDVNREYQIKAAFLYNFVQFVRWPSRAFSGDKAPLYIGILGDDPFGSALDDTVQGEIINGHPLAVIRAQHVEDLSGCQVIFICRSEAPQVSAILSQLDSKPTLTVSDLPGFAGMGGDIDFYTYGDKVRFEINPRVAEQCGLKLSSQLLALAKIIEP